MQPSASFTLTGHDFATIDLGVLGDPALPSVSLAHDINSTGIVVGESSTSGSPTLAFIWTPQTGMTSLGLVSPGDAYSRANAINDVGWVGGESGSRPVLWRPGQPGIHLGSDEVQGAALDVNNAGVVVGAYAVGGGQVRAFRWENGDLRDLGSLGGDFARAFGINNPGKIVGGTTDGIVRFEQAAIWDPATGSWTSLGVRDALGSEIAAGRKINDRGEIIGFYFPVRGPLSAFVWRPGTGATTLALGAEAHGINNVGQIVGSIGSDPVLWDPIAGTVRLFTLGGASGTARGINDAGRIVGFSQNAAGKSHATLWRPNAAPVARIDAPSTGMKKKPLIFSAARSTDADGDALTFSWSFGDGTSIATGQSVIHEYGDWGSYAVTLTARDAYGLSSSVTSAVVIAPPGQLKSR